jgi:hypothetical protein
VNGLRLPSVTSILSVLSKPALVAWSAKVEREMVIAEAGKLHELAGPEVKSASFALMLQNALGKEKAHTKALRKAGEIGSDLHSLIEWGLRGELCQKVGPSPQIGPEAQIAYASWQKWRQKVNLKPIWVERTVWSTQYGYAGTADLLALVDGVETLLDWKTGRAVYAESHLQNIAYRQCVLEMRIGFPVKGLILRLPKTKEDPDFEPVDVPGYFGSQLDTFLHAMALWKWQQETSKLPEDEEVRV